MFFRRIMLVLAALVLLIPAADANNFVFRYKPGLVSASTNPGNPGGPGSGSYDVTANFVAFIGEQFTARVPLKPGSFIASWSVQSGRFPEGISFDPITGNFTGAPIAEVQDSQTILVAYDSAGTISSRASVTFSVLKRTGENALPVDYYAHTGTVTSNMLPRPSGTAVASWVPLASLPGGISIVGEFLYGQPTSAGVYGLALSGKDYLGNEIAFAKGSFTVEDGPVVEGIPDSILRPDDLTNFTMTPVVKRAVGSLRWALIDGSLPSGLSFDFETGTISGHVSTFNTSATLKLKVQDSDGTTGVSNPFTLSTGGPVVDIAAARDQSLTLGVPSGFGFSAKDLSGVQTWTVTEGSLPEGMTIDPATGYISGTPTKVEKQEGVVVAVSTSDDGAATSSPFSIEVHHTPIVVSLPDQATPDKGYHVRVNAQFATAAATVTGAKAPWTFHVAEGASLPSGLSVDPQTGSVSGSLAATGRNSVAIALTDADDRTSSTLTVGITAYGQLGLSVSPDSIQAARMQRIESISPTVASDSIIPSLAAPFGSFSIVGTLPQGLSIASDTGSITGAPALEGQFGPLYVKVTDASGQSALSNGFNISVGPRTAMTASAIATEVFRVVPVYVQAIGSKFGIGAVTYEMSQGTLPSGISLLPNGYLQGQTAATGDFPGIVVKATDSDGFEAFTAPFTLSLVTPGNISVDAAVFDWTAGKPFSSPPLNVQNSGGGTVFTADPSAPLPSGTSMDPTTGSVAGTLWVPGGTEVTVRATDLSGRSGTGSLTLAMHPDMAIGLAPSYSAPKYGSVAIVPTVTDAIGVKTFAQTGTLPAGLTFNAADGSITGSPTVEGNFPGITVSVRDKALNIATATTSIKVGPREQLVVAYDFSGALTVGSGIGLPRFPLAPTYAAGATEYAVSGTLPPGMSFDTVTGAFKGVPSQGGIYGGLTVSARDSEDYTAATAPMSIRIIPNGPIDVDSPVFRQARQNEFFGTAAVGVGNVVRPIAFSPAQGTSVPGGFTLDAATGKIVGFSASTGSWTLPLTVTDAVSRTKDFSLRLDVVGPLTMSTPPVPQASQYVGFSLRPTVVNAIGSVNWAFHGVIPPGLSFDQATGALSGIPTAPATYSGLNITAEDSENGTAQTGAFSITVAPRGQLVATIQSSTTAILNKPFSIGPTVSNAIGDVSYAISGTLPPGLSMDPLSGKITGTATGASATYSNIRITASDAYGGSAQTGALSISTLIDGQPILLTVFDKNTRPGVAFSTQLPTVANAAGEVTFHSDDAASYGLTIDPATGVITGTIASPADIIVNVFVTDSSNRVTSKPVLIRVLPPLSVAYPPTVEWWVNASSPVILPATSNALGTVSYTISGSLPAGVAFDPSTGQIYGIPTQSGVYQLQVRATDSDGGSSLSAVFTLNVSAAAPSASTLMAFSFLNDGTSVAYQKFYDGDTSNAWYAQIAPGKALVVDFGMPVSLDRIYLAFGSLQSLRIEYEAGGKWIDEGRTASSGSGSYLGYVLMGKNVVGTRIRAVNTGTNPLMVSEMRVGGGAAYTAPVINQSGTIATLSDTTSQTTITAALSSYQYVNVVGDPVFSVVSGAFPAGSSLAANGVLSLPSKNSVSGTSWAATVQVTDAAGFSSQKLLQVASPAALASQVLPVSATVSGVPFNPGVLYDNVLSGGISFNSGQYLELDFGQPVRFTNAYYASYASGGAFKIQYEVDGTFLTDLPSAYLGSGTIAAFAERTARKIRLVPSTSTGVSLYEFRLGNGPLQLNPTITTPRGYIAQLGATSSSFQVAGTVPARNYAAIGTERYEVSAGSLPSGASMSPNGLISLPAASGSSPGSWQFDVRHYDATGFYADQTFLIGQNIPLASTLLPASVTSTRTVNNFAWRFLYDGTSTTTTEQIDYNGDITLDFGRDVRFSSLYYSTNSSSNLKVEYQVGTSNYWVVLANINWTASTVSGFGEITTSKIKISNTNGSSIGLGEFRVGGGPAHPVPVIDQSGVVATLQAGATSSVQLTGTVSNTYVAGSPTWTKAAGGPAGMTLSQSGLLTLPARETTPTTPTSWTFNVTLTDAAGFSTLKTLTVNR